LNIINDILDFSKIEAGRFTLQSCEFSIDQLLQEVMRMMAVSAHDRGLELLYDNPLELPEGVLGDPGRLRQVVVNLLGNALKFTEAGEVRLSVMGQERTEHCLELHFAVSDTGIGISPEWKERIFAAFVQADGSHTRRYGGTGLGLSISSRLVEFMGGRMWAESEIGRGSTFHFTAGFGLTATPPRQARIPAIETLRNLPVLVVDDNASNRRILDNTLRRWRMRPVLADSGRQAIEIMQWHAAAADPFALILIDAQMPGIDGFQLARQIQQDGMAAGPRILMLSSLDLKSIGPEFRDGGHYVTKPVTAPALRQAFMRALEGAPRCVAESPTIRPAAR
jgi:CheY-like chemotaxis protein